MENQAEQDSDPSIEEVGSSFRRRTPMIRRFSSPKAESDDEDLSEVNALPGEESDSACEDLDEEFNDSDVKPLIPQNFLDMADEALSGLPPRWRNWLTRLISGFCLISGFSFLVWLGPIGLFFLTYLVLFTSLNEVLRLGMKICRIHDEKTHRLCWVIIAVFEYYLVAPAFWKPLLSLVNTSSISTVVATLVRHHEAISFSLYLSCVVFFILTVQRSDYLRMYAILAWTHMGLIFLAIPGHLLNLTTLSGMIWYVVPMSLITINDIAAYMVGFFLGKTPLIKLSPKKTQEGFIGGAVITILIGTLFSWWISLKPSMYCPVEMTAPFSLSVFHCTPPPLFESYDWTIFDILTLDVNRFLWHGFVISVFTSLIGPFGGFFASGFKRACKRKNFGSVIPGHGGVLDRCDCMFLMAIFIHVYHNFLKAEQLL